LSYPCNLLAPIPPSSRRYCQLHFKWDVGGLDGLARGCQIFVVSIWCRQTYALNELQPIQPRGALVRSSGLPPSTKELLLNHVTWRAIRSHLRAFSILAGTNAVARKAKFHLASAIVQPPTRCHVRPCCASDPTSEDMGLELQRTDFWCPLRAAPEHGSPPPPRLPAQVSILNH